MSGWRNLITTQFIRCSEGFGSCRDFLYVLCLPYLFVFVCISASSILSSPAAIRACFVLGLFGIGHVLAYAILFFLIGAPSYWRNKQ